MSFPTWEPGRPRLAFLSPDEPVARFAWKVLPPGQRKGYWESDAELWERMQALTRESVTRALGAWLDEAAIAPIITRRDAMGAEVDKLIAKKGRALVLIP